MTTYSTSKGEILQAMNTNIEDGFTIQTDSVHDYFHRTVGEGANKTITLSANNTTASENIFQITGDIQIYRMWACVTDATTLANCTSASFDLYDGTAAVQISAATGVLSGVAVNTLIAKTGLAANAFDISNAVAGALIEQTYEGADVFSRFVLSQKNSTATYIRFTYSTTDAPINAQLKVYVEYNPLNGGTLVAV
jgi:hypothetical protein